MRRLTLTLTAVAGAALALTGCTPAASTSHPTPTQKAVRYTPSAQVASVVAEYEPDWRGTIKDTGHCRMVWVAGGSDTDDYICRTQEETIGITASLVLRSWSKMHPSSSMSDLVDDTSDVLQKISDIDLTTECGDDNWGEAGKACSSALGRRSLLYTQLDSELNAWQPYL